MRLTNISNNLNFSTTERMVKKVKLWLAYWPSQWQSATDEESVIDCIFGVFTSRENAEAILKARIAPKKWEGFHDEFVFEELNTDECHPVPHI